MNRWHSLWCLQIPRFFLMAFGQAKLLFPTLGRLLPECPILRIDRVPFKLPALFNLFSEELLPIKRHDVRTLKTRPPLPTRDGLADLGSPDGRAAPQPLTTRRSNPNVNCVNARADQWRLIKLLRVLQISHCQKISNSLRQPSLCLVVLQPSALRFGGSAMPTDFRYGLRPGRLSRSRSPRAWATLLAAMTSRLRIDTTEDSA